MDFEERQIEAAKSGTEQEFYSCVLFDQREVNSASEATFDISTISFDAHRSIVNIRGIGLGRYEKNPIVLFNHDYDKPVGRSMWVKVANPEKTIMRAGMKFSDSTQTAKDTRALVADGTLRGASMGFIPRGSKFDDEAKKAFESDFSDIGARAPQNLELYIPECELCEWSIVSVPSNMDTLKNKLSELDPYLRMSITSEMYGLKIEELEKRHKDISQKLETEKTERAEERKQLIEIFKDALKQFKAGDVKRKPETLSLSETAVEEAIQKYINSKKGIF